MTVKLYVDGGNLGANPSPLGVYWSVGREHADGSVELLTERQESASYTSNNHAEYLALIDALRHATTLSGQEAIERVVIHSDSQLIVNQFNGKWTINDPLLRELCTAAHRGAEFLITGLGVDVEVTWVRRAENVKRLGH